MMLLRTPSLLPLSLLHLARAYDGVGGEHVYVFPAHHAGADTPTVFSTPYSDLEPYIASPDASSSVPIAGFNLSSTPANISSDWTLSLAVAVDVPLPRSSKKSSSDDDGGEGLAFALSALSLTAPEEDVLVPEESRGVGHDNWRVCAIVFPGLNDTATRAGQNVEEDCEGAISDKCREDLLRNVRTGHNSWGGQFCSDAGIPESCPFPDNIKPSTIQLHPNEPSFPFYVLGAAPAPAGNATKALQAITNIWPVLMSWEHRNGGFLDGGDASTERSDLYCLRASKVGANSTAGKMKTVTAAVKGKVVDINEAVPSRDDGLNETYVSEEDGGDENGAAGGSVWGVLGLTTLTMIMVAMV